MPNKVQKAGDEERFRLEKDSLGEVHVPVDALYGPQTQRAVDNFPISGTRMPRQFLQALAMVKRAAAAVNRELNLLPGNISLAIQEAAREVEEGRHDAQFPVDVYQTGSGTSTNMNANEVIATLASRRLGIRVHPNDHVNMGQSSNDVIPSSIHISAYQAVVGDLLPAMRALGVRIAEKESDVDDVVKIGRTHLMDALPIRMSQELSGWRKQVLDVADRLEGTLPRIAELAIGATAVGTGANAPREFGPRVVALLAQETGHPFRQSWNLFASLSSQDAAVELGAQLKVAAVTLIKISNDLRWMNSGPASGLGEIRLPAVQPGSSIMPGKVNPVIPEAVIMACVRVIGNDMAITLAGQSGNFQLNVMLPLIASCLLESIRLLTQSCSVLADKAVKGFQVDRDLLRARVEHNLMLVTVLTPILGYERSAEIAMRAFEEHRSLKEVAAEMTDMTAEELGRLLDPARVTNQRETIP